MNDSKIIEHFFSITSPWTYLGIDRLHEMAARHGVRVIHKPADFGQIFAVSGGLPLPKRSPQRQAYRMAELFRWRDHLGIPINPSPKHFPAQGWPAAGMVTAAREQGLECGPLAAGILRAIWAEERNIDDRATLKEVADAAGLDGAALLEAADGEATKAQFAADTQEAIDRHVFGAPTYIYGDMLLWGQDRLEFLERALAKG